MLTVSAMVVPVDEVTQVTHLVEGLMEAARQDPAADWPIDSLERYVGWIGELADPYGSVSTTLANGVKLEAELAATI